MATGAEPTQAPGWELFAQWHALIDRGDPRFTLVSTVEDVAAAAGPSWRPRSGQHVEHAAAPDDRAIRTARRPARREPAPQGVSSMRMILPRRVAERRSPLGQQLRAGPAPGTGRPPADDLRRAPGPRGRLHGRDGVDQRRTRRSSARAVGLLRPAVASRPSRPCRRGRSRRSPGGWSTSAACSSTARPTARSPGPWGSPSAPCRPTCARCRAGSGARSRAHAIALISGVEDG